jgi:hypothetical protein
MNTMEIEKCESEFIEHGYSRGVAKWVCTGKKMSEEEEHFDLEADREHEKRNRSEDY